MNSYSPLTHYEIIEENGVRYFKGMLNLPMAVGTVGGSVYRNPLYQESLNLLGNPNSQ
jgi:hydroxymethylglutaryl-CoA reductase